MSLFKSSNPVLQESVYKGTVFEGMAEAGANTMTIKGTLNKFGILTLLMLATSVFSWKYAETGKNIMPLILISIIGGLILSIIMYRKPAQSAYLAPAYALLEGLFVGAISAYFEYGAMASGGYSGIVFQAVGLTFTVSAVMYGLYYFRIIKVTQKLRAIITVATVSVMVFYLITWVLSMFNVNIPFLYQNTALSIGFSVLMVGLAAFNLLLNFDNIETGTQMGAPKFMEWYSAFGLLVTLVWLYLEMLRLLAKLNRD
ncbi:MAG: Bax inhibitor-1/YccA family protein [Dinghuibacter sp.]|nr:Bax inhibitor-1/YccA family protein [Dinghuibacter sp.]